MNRLIPNKLYLSFVITPIFMLVVAFTIAGCTNTRQIITLDKHVASEQFKFLLNGSTSQKEVLNRLGVPWNRYENGRILTYSIYGDLDYRLYNLVLVFGTDFILEHHSFVQVR